MKAKTTVTGDGYEITFPEGLVLSNNETLFLETVIDGADADTTYAVQPSLPLGGSRQMKRDK